MSAYQFYTAVLLAGSSCTNVHNATLTLRLCADFLTDQALTGHCSL